MLIFEQDLFYKRQKLSEKKHEIINASRVALKMLFTKF